MKKHCKCIIQSKSILINDQQYEVVKYRRNDFTEDDWFDYIDYDNRMYYDLYNEIDETSYADKKHHLTDVEGDYDNHRWLVINDSGKMVARGFLWFYNEASDLYEQNKFVADLYVDVDKAFRGRGIGSLLIEELLQAAKEMDKLKVQSNYMQEDASFFASKYDFKIASERTLSRLNLDELDIELMKQWSQGSRDIEIYKTIPEKYIEEYCKLYTACGIMAPDYEGDYEATEQLTPKALRTREKNFFEKGIHLYTAIAIEEDGTLSGMTELDYSDSNPKEADQGLTGVLENYRGKGIGKQLKSSLLLYLMDVNPKLEYVSTANNNHNHPMLGINKQMGFKSMNSHYLVTKKLK